MDRSQSGFLKFYGTICLIGLIATVLHNVSSSQFSSKNGEWIAVLLFVGFGVLVAMALSKRGSKS